ncbi:MAG: hypothetical protein VX874_11570 [Pseudomonadota bacterium]|nr:hypothetical protein [Pseudomonadota bacterium]
MTDDRRLGALGEDQILDFVNHAASTEERIEIARHLSTDPRAAARTMSQIADREELVLALGLRQELAMLPSLPEPVTSRRVGAGRMLFVASVALAAFGIGSVAFQSQPFDALASAKAADDTTRLRLELASVNEDIDIDAAEISASTGIRLPALPDTWRIVDAQVYPSTQGASVVLTAEVPQEGLVTLYAIKSGEDRDLDPEAIWDEAGQAARFREGGVEYVLFGRQAIEPLDDEAAVLLASLPS